MAHEDDAAVPPGEGEEGAGSGALQGETQRGATVTTVAQVLEIYQQWGEQLASYLQRLNATLAPALAAISEGYARLEASRPPNWPTVFAYPRLHALMKDGFPVVWVPSQDVLQELLGKATPDERVQVLVDRQEDVLSHALELLSEIDHPALAAHRELMRQAIVCLPSAPAPAQALSLQLATVIAQEELKMATLSALKKELTRLADGVPQSMADVIGLMSLLTVAPLLNQFRPNQGDGVPSTPNRHAVAHTVSLAQYTPGNAIWSVLIAMGVLRQAQENLLSSNRGRAEA